MPTRDTLGGIVHSYQKYDPVRVPPPRGPMPDVLSAAMDRLLEFGADGDAEFTAEQLAEAIELSPEDLKNLGPSLDSVRKALEERRRRILERYEIDAARKKARGAFRDAARQAEPPRRHREEFERAVREEQLRRLERLWYAQDDDASRFAARLVGIIERLGDVYQVDELASKWTFTGREKLTVARALEVKAELEEIEDLLRQLEEVRKNARLAIIDMEALARHVESGELDELANLKRQVQDLVEQAAARQGLERTKQGYALTPKALRTFQGTLLEQIFSALAPSRTGRHQAGVTGDGAVEIVPTRPYEFGDSVAHMDIPARSSTPCSAGRPRAAREGRCGSIRATSRCTRPATRPSAPRAWCST